jgi:hypothetical protein
VVVAVGLTLVEPLAEVDVKVPGVMETLVAPVVDQLSVLLEPELMLVGLAVKELSVGGVCFLPGTVTTTLAVVEPARLVARKVYVVVFVGFTVIDPLAFFDV